MKKILILFIVSVVCLSLSGCASSRIGTIIGGKIGSSFIKAAELGKIDAPKTIAAWPYISGMIKGNPKYNNVDRPAVLTTVVNELDKLASLTVPLTLEQCGNVTVLVIQLELEGGDWIIKTYGMSLYNMFLSYTGGGI